LSVRRFGVVCFRRVKSRRWLTSRLTAFSFWFSLSYAFSVIRGRVVGCESRLSALETAAEGETTRFLGWCGRCVGRRVRPRPCRARPDRAPRTAPDRWPLRPGFRRVSTSVADYAGTAFAGRSGPSAPRGGSAGVKRRSNAQGSESPSDPQREVFSLEVLSARQSARRHVHCELRCDDHAP
jgi:hypothetical protein